MNIDFDEYAKAAASHLVQFGVGDDQIDRYTFVEVAEGAGNFRGRGGGIIRIIGVEYWIRLKRCEKGAVIVEVDQSCQVRQAYARGGCMVDGLKQYR